MLNSIQRLLRLNKDKMEGNLAHRRRLFFQWIQLHRRYRGLPNGIDVETLDRIIGHPVKRVSYVHLSAWKSSGSFRLFVEGQSGRKWTLIYKDCVYDPKELPALKGMPISPGPPEYFVYKHARGRLLRYLPKVFLCLERQPGRHFQYVFEDLDVEHINLRRFGGNDLEGRRNMITAISQLPELHKTLDEWLADIDLSAILRYGGNFSSILLNHAKPILERYSQATSDETVLDLLGRWPLILQLHAHSHELRSGATRGIHGDYHSEHIYVHKSNPDGIKLIDWEWMGFGIPHADLASALKRASPDAERMGLEIFFTQVDTLSLGEHKSLYEWCQLERGIMDATYLAAQQMEAPRKVGWVSCYIRSSAARALRAVQELV